MTNFPCTNIVDFLNCVIISLSAIFQIKYLQRIFKKNLFLGHVVALTEHVLIPVIGVIYEMIRPTEIRLFMKAKINWKSQVQI